MSLTLLYRSKKTRFVYNISLKQLVSAVALISVFFLMSSRDTVRQDENLARINHHQQGLIDQQAKVDVLKQQTTQQLASMMLKLSDLQSQVHRVNALGQRLVDENNLDADEFGFNQMPAVGGIQEDAEIEIASSDSLIIKLDAMLAEFENKQQQLTALESILMNHHVEDESRLAGKPIASGWLSSYFGIRKDPFSGMPAMHKGLDFAGKAGSDVISTGAGIVTWSGDRYGYGHMVEIDHGDGLVTRYGHNQVLNVKVGDVVTKGQAIAQMGSTGRSTGAHVHYEVLRNGQQQDPLPFVYRK